MTRILLLLKALLELVIIHVCAIIIPTWHNLYVAFFIVFTHLLLCKFFVVYEAVTYECSLAAVLLALMNMWTHGLSIQSACLLAVCVGAAALNVCAQQHYYKKLRLIIDDTLNTRSFRDDIAVDMKNVISNAVAPSFSRFIEESKLLNNPANLFGLIKRTISRDRFQKRKFLLREKSAELLNYTSSFVPEGERSSKSDKEKSVQNKKIHPALWSLPKISLLTTVMKNAVCFASTFLGSVQYSIACGTCTPTLPRNPVFL